MPVAVRTPALFRCRAARTLLFLSPGSGNSPHGAMMRVRGRPTTVSDDQLLDAARDVFLARGLDATAAEIAARAGISESLVFYRYKTKEALFLAVVDRQIVLPEVLQTLDARV